MRKDTAYIFLTTDKKEFSLYLNLMRKDVAFIFLTPDKEEYSVCLLIRKGEAFIFLITTLTNLNGLPAIG